MATRMSATCILHDEDQNQAMFVIAIYFMYQGLTTKYSHFRIFRNKCLHYQHTILD